MTFALLIVARPFVIMTVGKYVGTLFDFTVVSEVGCSLPSTARSEVRPSETSNIPSIAENVINRVIDVLPGVEVGYF